MHGRAVRVAVNHSPHSVRAHRLGHGGCVDVHDLHRLAAGRNTAGVARPGRERTPGRQRQREELGLPLRIADHAPKFLVVPVVRAKGVAMHQEHAFALQFDHAAFRQQRYSRAPRETVSGQEIPVAVNEPRRNPA